MTVSRTVVALADLIATRVPLEGPRERIQLQILRLMPLYVEIWDLVAWESAFAEVMTREDSPEGSDAWVLEQLFDFGRGLMYGAFQESTAKSDYSHVRAQLLKVGIEVPVDAELHEW